MLHADQELCWRSSNQHEICLGPNIVYIIAGRANSGMWIPLPHSVHSVSFRWIILHSLILGQKSFSCLSFRSCLFLYLTWPLGWGAGIIYSTFFSLGIVTCLSSLSCSQMSDFITATPEAQNYVFGQGNICPQKSTVLPIFQPCD